MTIESGELRDFDFESHREQAIKEYRSIKPRYEVFATNLRNILTEALRVENIQVHSIEARAKDIDSFGDKAIKPSDEDPDSPKYPYPLSQITDLAGVRVIAFLPKTLHEIERVLASQFQILERTDKGQELTDKGKFGYQSIHFLVKLAEARAQLPEYSSCKDLFAEVQVRTILQHAWAELEHDIQYKSVSEIPKSIRRRFTALAGLLEIADREFQTIQDEDQQQRIISRESIATGTLTEVEITPDALNAYMDKKLGPDGRMREDSYSWMAGLLKRMGFKNLDQVEKCIAGYDDDQISRLLWGTRQGQSSRLEDMLFAGMGKNFIERHYFANEDWFRERRQELLGILQGSGIAIGTYSPEVDETLDESCYDAITSG